MHRIDGPGATVDNRFTDGDPVGGVQATMVTDDWANDVQEELMSILAAGGVAPVKGTQNQVLSALTTLIRGQGFSAYTTAGTSPAFTLAPSPAIDSYAAYQRFSVKFIAAAPTDGTLNVSGKGPKNLKQYDSTGAKVSAVIAANQVTDVVYDGTDLVVLNPISIPASDTVPGVVELANSGEVAAGTDVVRAVTSAGLAANYAQKFALVATEERATNVSSGNNLNGTNVRQLNTVRSNTIAGASLASNQITLPAGSYHVVGSAPFFNGDRHRCYLHNVTDNVSVLLGTAENAGTAFTTRSIVRGTFSIAATKVFEFRHSMQVAQTNGLGDPCADGQAEVYAEIEFVRGGN